MTIETHGFHMDKDNKQIVNLKDGKCMYNK